jgi:outer membrane protein, heavy metal efflux system
MRLPYLPMVAVCLSICGGAIAAESQSSPLTLASAVDRAIKYRPELTGFQYTLRAQDAKQAAAGLKPMPQLDVQIEDALGTGSRSGLDAMETTLLMSQVIELRGKREGREAVVIAERDGLQVQQAARQLDVVAEVALRFMAVIEWQLRHEMAQESVRLAEQAVAKVDERVQASRSPPAEAARAGVQLWDAKLLLDDSDHELEIARHFLAAAMGEERANFGTARGEFMTLPGPGSFESLVAKLPSTPELLRFATEERLRDAEIRLAEMQRRADPRVTLGLRRYEQGNDVALVAGVTLPLFASRAVQPSVDRLRAQRELVGAERDAQRLRLQAQLFSTLTQLQHEQDLSKTLREELLPRLETALEQATYAYERGRFSYLEWTVAQRELLEGRLRLLESAGRFHVLRVEIERLTGASLESGGERK